MKTFEECIRFANMNPIGYLATVDGDCPRVRALGMWFADRTGFYFQTSTLKQIPRQLEANPNIEICFYHPGQVVGEMLRITGRAEVLQGQQWCERAIADRPFLKGMGLSASSPELFLFRVAHGEAQCWTMENNLKPREMIRF